MWKKSRGLTDDAANGHACSGNTCSYSQIGDAFICERTGCVHGMHSPLPKLSMLDLFVTIFFCTVMQSVLIIAERLFSMLLVDLWCVLFLVNALIDCWILEMNQRPCNM